MSHDRLLTKLNRLPEIIGLADFKVRHDALIAVIELHSPTNDGMCKKCLALAGDYIDYPCSTIKAIEKELNNANV